MASPSLGSPRAPSALGMSSGHLLRYVVKHSEDVLDQTVKILVTEEDGGRVIWHKTRSLTETEIVDFVFSGEEQSPRWTIHRPRTGWYLRLRSPFFLPASFINLTPADNHPKDTFTCMVQTSIDFSRSTAGLRTGEGDHSYPPPAGMSSPNSTPRTSISSPSFGPTSSPVPSAAPQPQVMNFLIGPHPDSAHREGLLGNIVGKALRPSHHNFTIYTPTFPTLMTFHDRTPLLGVQTTGIIELDDGVAKVLGVDPAFWISVALAYLDFLSDRDGYRAATEP